MRKLIFLFTLAFTWCFYAEAQNVTFKLSAPNTVVVGQQFRLIYSSNKEGKELRIGEFSDFDVLMGPITQQSQSVVVNNGKMVSDVSYSFIYTLLATKEGSFTIPAASIKIGTSEYKSNSLTIKVLPKDRVATTEDQGSAGSGGGGGNVSSDGLFTRIIVSKNSVYENEGFLVSFKLYTLYDASPTNFKFPEFEGFVAQEIEFEPQWQLESYNGRNYRTAILKQTVLYPQRAGKITIGSGKFDVVARVKNQQRGGSVFDDFFDQQVDVKKILSTSPVTIDVKSLPAGKPASFSGAVGDYSMSSSISSQTIKSNESITIKVSINGNGNLKLIKNPEITFPNDFEVYDPKVENNTKVSTSGVSGAKTIEYYAVPRYAGDFVIPKAEFSYFDLKTGIYKTLSTNEFKLHVDQGAGGTTGQPVFNGSANKEDVKFVGKDIRYIKTRGGLFHPNREFFFGTLPYLLWYIIPAILFIVFFIINRKQATENANIALMRTKKANKVASKRLKQAGKFLKEHQKEAFYDEMLKALWGYLSDKLSIPVASLTKDNVEIEMTKYGMGEELIKEFMDILNTCEFARFAPAQDSHEMDELYESTVQAIDKMENTIKK